MNIRTKLKRFINELIDNVEDSEDTKNSINKTEITDKYCKLCDEWYNGAEYARLQHVCTLIVTAYETINVNVNSESLRDNARYTSNDYLEDYSVFFKNEVFNKLKEWCAEFNVLVKKEQEVRNTLMSYHNELYTLQEVITL